MVRCKGTCVTGKRCKKTVSNGTLCSVHRPKDVCSICLDEISKHSVLLDCKHNFCKKCISLWIIENKTCTCPNCRREISDIYKLSALAWSVANNHLFVANISYYYFDKLPEIDALLLISHIFEYPYPKIVFKDDEFEKIEDMLKDDINYYEIFKLLKQTIVKKRELLPVKSYPDKPESMHIFIL